MRQKLFLEDNERASPSGTPYLSHSRINRYLTCPEQYRLYYIEGLRPRYPSAGLVFGQVVHQGLATLFQDQGDPVAFFREAWDEVKQVELTYGQRESWERLKEAGEKLLEKFVQEELSKIGNIRAVEKPFKLNVTSLDLPLVGIIDLVADVDAESTLTDFKTSSSSYGEHEVVLSDQLTTYRIAEPDPARVALCVLVKAKEPKIEWYPTTRNGSQITEYLSKVELIAREIQLGRFYKRPGKWCAWCDFLPVCTADGQKIRETLVQAKA